MSTEKRGLDALGMVTEVCYFFSLDCRDAALTVSIKKCTAHHHLSHISDCCKKSLYIQDGYKLYYSSKEQRLDGILPLVIEWAAHVSQDAVNSSSLQAPFCCFRSIIWIGLSWI